MSNEGDGSVAGTSTNGGFTDIWDVSFTSIGSVWLGGVHSSVTVGLLMMPL